MSLLSLMNEDDVLEAIRFMVSQATGMLDNDIVLAGDNRKTGNMPKSPVYCTVEFEAAKPYGAPSQYQLKSQTTELLDMHIKQSYELPLRINFFGERAFDVACSLIEMNYIPAITTFLVQQNIGFRFAARPKRRPYVLQGKVKMKTIVDLTLSFETHRVIEQNPIHDVTIDIKVENNGDYIDVTNPEVTR